MRRGALISLAVAAVLGCTSVGGHQFDLVLPAVGDIPQVPITVNDTTGLVSAALAADPFPREPAADIGITNPPDDDRVLVVRWLGGACDEWYLISFDRGVGGLSLSLATHHRGGGCILIGIERAVTLGLAEPISAETVEFVELDTAVVGP
jgi:hypothetical protein